MMQPCGDAWMTTGRQAFYAAETIRTMDLWIVFGRSDQRFIGTWVYADVIRGPERV